MATARLLFAPDGKAVCFHTEAIDLRALGRLHIERATDITFNAHIQEWEVLRAGCPAVLFSHPSRQRCVDWELENLEPEDAETVQT